MAKAKTSPFYVTDTVTLSAAGTYTQSTIPFSSYIDVAAKQAVAILEVDYVTVAANTNRTYLGTDCIVDYQLTDINRGAMASPDDTALISRGALANDDTAPAMTNENAIYPDSFGSLEQARMVVNDDVFFGAMSTGVPAAGLTCAVRIKCQVVSLSQQDFMALALTSVASA